jgi:hypothetical protein
MSFPPTTRLPPQPNSAALWRLLEIQKESMVAVGKAQGRYMALLLGFVTVLWGWQFTQPQGMTVQLWGVSVQPNGLWTVAPAFLTAVSLALIGTMNAMGPVWKRLSDTAQALGVTYFWSDLDTTKNIVDYLVYLKLTPEGPAEATSPPRDITRKFQLTVFSYPAVLLLAVVTTMYADYPGATCKARLYIYGCASLQIIYGFRIWHRAVCRYFAVRRPQTEI